MTQRRHIDIYMTKSSRSLHQMAKKKKESVLVGFGIQEKQVYYEAE